jgi:hypothetical protein
MSRMQGRFALTVSLVVFMSVITLGAFAQAAVPAVSGTILSISGDRVTISLADKTQKIVVLQGSTLVLEREVAAVDQIRTGDAMGVAARRSGSDLVATSINIFSAEMWDVVRKGQWPMATGETMTNATVTDYVRSVNGRTLTMKYKDVMATITVPDGVQVHRLVSMKQTDLSAGMQVTVRGTPGADGTMVAGSVSFDAPAKS